MSKYNCIVVHYDEIGLKKGNRDFFEKQLISNIKTQIGRFIEKVNRERGQIIIDLKNGFSKKEITDKLSIMPGISFFIFSIKTSQSLDMIKNVAIDLFKGVEGTFKVDTRRHNKSFKLTSSEVNEKIGKNIQEEYKLKVFLNNPDNTLIIEICNNDACIGIERIQGVGGIGIGSAGKMLCMLSGGIDSPVAAYMMMKRGVNVEFIHFQNKTNLTRSTQRKIDELVTQLAVIQSNAKLTIIPFETIQKEIIMAIPAKYRMIIYRRFMTRISERIANESKIKALITGDSLSQVASQTIQNLDVIHASTSMMILSPLIGLNKNEIIKIAKQISTYDISIQPYNDCCSFFIAKNPEIKSRIQEIERLESKLDIEKLIESGIKNKIVKDF